MTGIMIDVAVQASTGPPGIGQTCTGSEINGRGDDGDD
jgi:hypothetical protein